MTDGYQPNRSRDVMFIIFGVVGSILIYHAFRWAMELYDWFVSTDIIRGLVSWWTTAYTVTIVPAELFYTLIGVLFVVIILIIILFFSITERPF